VTTVIRILRGLRIRLLLLPAIVAASLLSPGISPQAGAQPAGTPPGGPGAEPVLAWRLEMDVPAPSVATASDAAMAGAKAQLADVLASKLQGSGTTRTVDETTLDGQPGFRVTLVGNTDDTHLRELLLGSLSPEFDVLGGPMELAITGHARSGQSLPVSLESRPSTGYGWELAPGSADFVRPIGGFTVRQDTQRLGSPASTSVVLQATADADVTVRLIYRRPWETEAATTRRLSVQAADWPDSLDLTSAVLSPAEVASSSDIPTGPPLVHTDALPTSWDWRLHGGVPTAVRNQGGCGSCWAFGTVGVLESALMIGGAVTGSVDLSEQFLVSCNTYGYNCSKGGWWSAQDFHTNVTASQQSQIGAVTETDMPYQGTDGTCKVIASHPYRLTAWYYVAGYPIPTVDQIKSAILAHGPVGASVCAGSAFQSYRSGSGIFATDESAACGGPGETNHAIVLVGWNDNSGNGYWILRNSWGAGWGQSGYMYIKWGTSSVGYAANYVVYVNPNLKYHVYLPGVVQ
jgi:C1A family cysteine protease